MKIYLALNNLQWLISNKTNPNQTKVHRTRQMTGVYLHVLKMQFEYHIWPSNVSPETLTTTYDS